MSFTRTNAGDGRDSFSDYHLPNIEIKDLNILIDGRSFFDAAVKNEEEAFKNSKFATKKWYVIDSETSGAYSENEQIKFLTKSIEPGFCD